MLAVILDKDTHLVIFILHEIHLQKFQHFVHLYIPLPEVIIITGSNFSWLCMEHAIFYNRYLQITIMRAD